MKSSILLFSCFILAGTLSWGQAAAGDDLLKGIEIDSLLEANYNKLMVFNSKVRGVPGYRIRIFSESGITAREQLQDERVRFHTIFPEIDTYDDYDGVYFKLYIGDCRTRSEALKLYDLIKKEFPNPIIREDYINIK
jgi:hypothetical protein